jgi:GT2 family glycosyltransferase
MPRVSVIIPSRNEIFLKKTTEDILSKAKNDIEVLVVLEGYWPPPEEIIDDPRVKYIHNGKPKGLRGAVMGAVEVAKGEYIMKIDAHCMFSKGYDVALAGDCKDDWVAIPRRYPLDAENWKIQERKDNKYPIDYMYVACPGKNNKGDLGGEIWHERNRDPKLEKVLVDDLMTFQGSCWFMKRDYFKKLGLFDIKSYGTFRKEPQEISMKAWLSGGRVVRNKKAWYAHLHKGSKYKRGYGFKKGDWNKGDEFNKKWLTNEAWKGGKQTKTFKWLVDKFNPPGWDNHDWSSYIPLKTKTPQKIAKRPRTYQNIELDGKDIGQNPKKKNSKFWNEGKWKTFIEPLLPNEDFSDQTFFEVGCNAGLFLKLAKEKGFKNVIGIDKDRKAVETGVLYRDRHGQDYRIDCREIGKDFDFDEIPVADVTLLSTVHYYFDIADWFKFLDRLRSKTRYCLIVSRSVDKDQHWRPSGELADIRHYFRDWREVGAVDDIQTRGDPHPRVLWSLMFESDLIRMPVDKIYIKNERHRTWVEDYKLMNRAKIKLAEGIAKNDRIDIEKTDYYKRWVKRKEKSWSAKKIRRFVQGKVDLMYDVKHNGLKEPIITTLNGQICDGGHRLAILRAMDYKSVIVRAV